MGYGSDITIRELVAKIASITEYKGKIIFDRSKPDGTPRKLLDISLMKSINWKPIYDLNEGLIKTYAFFQKETKK